MNSSGNLSVRTATEHDAPALAAIYNHYVANSTISFEEDPVPVAQMAERIADVLAVPLPWIVAEQDGRVLGYANAHKWKPRAAYRFSVETTVYVAPDLVASGVGTRLYAELFEALRRLDVNAVIGGIALPNDASIALHEKFGMKKVAHFEQVGFKFGRWIDVAYWQMQLKDAPGALR